jgi:tRNA (guanine9-N1)-methyltransferase
MLEEKKKPFMEKDDSVKALYSLSPSTTPPRLTKQAKKTAKYEHRKDVLKDKKDNAKMRLKEKLKLISHEEKIAFSANKKLEKQRKADNAASAMNSDIKVCIDLSFNEINSPREQRSLVKQCTLAYAAIRNSTHGIALHISSLQGVVNQSLGEQGIEKWHIQRHISSAFEVFARENVVMLSPDAEDILTELDKSKVYVIGGIVDRTVRNNLTLDRACEHGVTAMRLPVKEYFPQAQSHVINIDQVVSLFCTYQETRDWQVKELKCFKRLID